MWPVIAGLKGNPLATLQHCMGTRGDPDDAVLDFISNTVVAEVPLDEAALSLVEIRTLGGAGYGRPDNRLRFHPFAKFL